MKRLFLPVILILLSFALNALPVKVCVCPQNPEIVSYLCSYFPQETEIVTSDPSFDHSFISTLDPELLSMLAIQNNSELLLIPLITEVSSFNRLRLYAFNLYDKTISKVFEELNQESNKFPDRCILPLASYFYPEGVASFDLIGAEKGTVVSIDGKPYPAGQTNFTTTLGLHEITLKAPGFVTQNFDITLNADEKQEIQVSQKAEIAESLFITSNVPAEIWLDGKLFSSTPAEINNFPTNSSLILKSNNYADLIVHVRNGQNQIEAELKPKWMEDNSLAYSIQKERFYQNLAVSFLLFGLRVATSSFEGNVSQAIKMTTNGLLAVSLLSLSGNLFEYFRYTQYASQ